MSKAKIINFKEGGTLVYKHKKRIPYTGCHIGFKVGHANNDENIGCAHFLEHMFLKGTTTKTADEVLDAKQKICPTINAITTSSSTLTNFYRTNKLLEQSLALVSDMMLNTNIQQQHIDVEKKVIQEELRLTENKRVSDLLYNKRQTSSNKQSQYGLTFFDWLGTYESLENMKAEELIAFQKNIIILTIL